MKLSDQQVRHIRKQIEDSGIQLESLLEDVLDHLCCVVEVKMAQGKEFQTAAQEAEEELAPNGLAEIEQETVFLLNAHKISRMKKLTFSMGIIGSIALTGGATFKLLHLPGANQLFMIGYLVFLLVFIPLLAFDRFKYSIVKALSERVIILGVISSIILGMAGAFKIMHLPGDHLLLMCGLILFAAFFLPLLLFNLYKKSFS